jgi:hypothetical protein
VEGLVRGYRSAFLDDVDYHHLTQCETLEGAEEKRFKMETIQALTASRCQAEPPGDGL